MGDHQHKHSPYNDELFNVFLTQGGTSLPDRRLCTSMFYMGNIKPENISLGAYMPKTEIESAKLRSAVQHVN